MKKVLFVFGQLIDSDIEWMIAAGTTQKIPAGHILIEEAAGLQNLYIVLAGELVVRVKALGDREVGRAGCGELLGEMSFIDSRPTSATVIALKDSVVFAVSRAQVAEKLRTDMAFAARFYRALALLLSDKVRARGGMLPYGDSSAWDGEIQAVNEIDEGVLDEVHLAGARFERMLKRLA